MKKLIVADDINSSH